MARSSSIYLVYDGQDRAGAFTVKHEMFSWIERQKFNHKPTIVKIQDGAHQKKGVSSPVEFEGTWNSWSGR
jgi:hypothetical protein